MLKMLVYSDSIRRLATAPHKMRTTTTTREQTRNRANNFALKMFCWHLGHLTPVFREIYEKIVKIECDHVIESAHELTDDLHAIYAINVYLKVECNDIL